MNDSIQVMGLGAKVSVGSREGVIVGVMIRTGQEVRYEVAWWDGGVRYEAWVHACEVRASVEEIRRIGFQQIDFHPGLSKP